MPVLPAMERRLRVADPSPYYGYDKTREQNNNILGQGMLRAPDFLVKPLPQYDYLSQAQNLSEKTRELLAQSAANAAYNNTPNISYGGLKVNRSGGSGRSGGGSGGGGSLDRLLRALGAQESGNRYGAVNRSSGAMGRWQVMPANIRGTRRGWDYEVLGRDVSTSQFLNSPSIQNAIVRAKFGNYYKQHGARGALSAWYSGDPNKWNSRTPQGGYPSIYRYIQQVLNRM